jgi:hypothetical protein
MATLKVTNTEMIETSHGKRTKDVAVSSEGTSSHPGPALSATLKTPQLVNKVTVQKAADGTLHITLEK